jgi:hypothetical protein
LARSINSKRQLNVWKPAAEVNGVVPLMLKFILSVPAPASQFPEVMSDLVFELLIASLRLRKPSPLLGK